jgi:phosphatidylserine/phosphatidylglycerophosphate/cardiolipin synthase-like enzyme
VTSSRHRLIALAICAALLLLAGCSPLAPFEDATETATCDTGPPPSEVDGVYVLPDDGRDPVLHEIDRARCSIDVTVYLISDDAVIEALARAETRGVRVRLIHEPTPFGGGFGTVEVAEQLQQAGVEVRPGPSHFQFIHAKYLVIDDRVAIVTNQNLTYSAFESNREFGVVTTNRQDVATLAAIFEADWNDTATPVTGGRLIVSPQNARQRLLEVIGGAETSIDLYAEVIRDDEVIDALSTAAQRGVRVRVIVNAPEDALDATVGDVLASNGVQVRVDRALYIHAKAMVIDGAAVVIGSTNPTATSLDRNREVSLLVADRTAAARVMAVFERDWINSAPWQVGAATGSIENRGLRGLDLDMLMVYGYRVRTVPRGLTQITGQQDQVPALRGNGTGRFGPGRG